MKLAQYMKEHGLNDRDMAGKAKLSRSYITRLRNGLVPSMTAAKEIFRATNGAVSADDWMEAAQ